MERTKSEVEIIQSRIRFQAAFILPFGVKAVIDRGRE